MRDSESSSEYSVPLGWLAFVAGVLTCIAALMSRLGVLTKTDQPIGGLGLALVVGGYISCFIIPPLNRRVSSLEQRVSEIENSPVQDVQSPGTS